MSPAAKKRRKGGREAARRKGARRISAIPPAIRRALDEGREETITLVEWLAIDKAKLLAHVLPQAGFAPGEVAALVAHARSLASEGVTVRVKKVSAKLHELLVAVPARRRRKLYDALAGHRSDMVRSLAGYTHLADETLELERRLALARRYAADPHMGVREGAWDSIRSWLAEDLERAFELLEPWARDPDPNVRRCAIEATRPRGVWTRHLEPLKQDPSPGLVLLEPCRSDSSDYVRRAVANWLNDASKSRPDWVKRLCARWLEESPTKETQWIVRRSLRTVGRTRE